MKFDSMAERACYFHLMYLERAGKIQILGRQSNVYLTDAKIIYRADFKILDKVRNREVWVEFKGAETPVWRVKKKLWRYYGPGILQIYRGRVDRIFLEEEVFSLVQP